MTCRSARARSFCCRRICATRRSDRSRGRSGSSSKAPAGRATRTGSSGSASSAGRSSIGSRWPPPTWSRICHRYSPPFTPISLRADVESAGACIRERSRHRDGRSFRPEEREMKFGIFYELQLPRPWTPEGEFTLYQNALDQVELADRLGYDFAWEVEHHFLEEYSHSPAPEVFLAAASQRTKQIRLAHGIMQLTTVHPARVAERIAALDLVSRGRVEFGMGESASITELEPFDRDFKEKRAVWEDAVRAVIPMFREGGCEYHGTHFDFPLRNVVPKPLQKPHPPLWVACSQLDTIEMAGRRGLGALAFQFLSADAAHAWVHAYYNAYTKRLDKLTDYVTNPNIALTSYCMCAETDEEARRRADGIRFFQFALRFYGLSPNRNVRNPVRSICGTNTRSGSARTPPGSPARSPA